jgi:hypothetical protein
VAAGKYDLCIEQGATFRRVLKLRNGGSTVDLTGYTVRAQIRPTPGSDTLFHNMTPDILVDALMGEITLVIPHTDTETFTWKQAYWDLELVEPGGDVVRLLKGKATNDPEVTA